jgi:hypothetical protein
LSEGFRYKRKVTNKARESSSVVSEPRRVVSMAKLIRTAKFNANLVGSPAAVSTGAQNDSWREQEDLMNRLGILKVFDRSWRTISQEIRRRA